MKVVLLSPPQNDKMFPSLGIAYIGAVLKKSGHDILIIDGAGISLKEMIASIKDYHPDIAGITMNTTNRFDVLELAKQIKSNLKIPIILGGPHPTLLPDQLLKNYKYIDFIVRNEGEYSTLELVNSLEKKKTFSNIKGISYRDNNKVIHNPPAEPILDLDKLPFPDWSFFNLKKYSKQVEYPEKYKKYPVGSVISSRGCPFRCTFCSSSQFWGHKNRLRSPENIIGEIKMLYGLGIRFIVFNDDNFSSNTKRAIQICKLMIKEGLSEKMGWQCRAEVNVMNEELIKWMKKANCNMIEFGIEDCTQEGLKWFKKSHTQQQVDKAFDLCRKYKIKTKSYFIVGGDHETKENIKRKKKYIENLNPDITTASILLAYPGTEVYDLGKNQKLFDESVWLDNCVGEKFHSRAPIYTGPHLSYSELISASADINYWWGRKKGQYGIKDNIKIAVDMLKQGDINKLFRMSLAVIKQKLSFK
ncbi:MAG: B12-binding domain-containing radical SAM protein [Nanoarchaeota archaeon]|nr:B12-binding domain-containing radical SAM protein [Nanoarchaeota archaeon]